MLTDLFSETSEIFLIWAHLHPLPRLVSVCTVVVYCLKIRKRWPGCGGIVLHDECCRKDPKANPSLTLRTSQYIVLYYTGYDRVRSNLLKITTALKSTPGARENLILHYIQHQWLGTTENPAESELVKLALVRIKQDPSQFDLFIDMLCDTEGMDLIVTTLTGGELRLASLLGRFTTRRIVLETRLSCDVPYIPTSIGPSMIIVQGRKHLKFQPQGVFVDVKIMGVKWNHSLVTRLSPAMQSLKHLTWKSRRALSRE